MYRNSTRSSYPEFLDIYNGDENISRQRNLYHYHNNIDSLI